MSPNERRLIEAYRATGRVVFLHPRKRTISLNGGGAVPWLEAIQRIQLTLARCTLTIAAPVKAAAPSTPSINPPTPKG